MLKQAAIVPILSSWSLTHPVCTAVPPMHPIVYHTSSNHRRAAQKLYLCFFITVHLFSPGLNSVRKQILLLTPRATGYTLNKEQLPGQITFHAFHHLKFNFFTWRANKFSLYQKNYLENTSFIIIIEFSPRITKNAKPLLKGKSWSAAGNAEVALAGKSKDVRVHKLYQLQVL